MVTKTKTVSQQAMEVESLVLVVVARLDAGPKDGLDWSVIAKQLADAARGAKRIAESFAHGA